MLSADHTDVFSSAVRCFKLLCAKWTLLEFKQYISDVICKSRLADFNIPRLQILLIGEQLIGMKCFYSKMAVYSNAFVQMVFLRTKLVRSVCVSLNSHNTLRKSDLSFVTSDFLVRFYFSQWFLHFESLTRPCCPFAPQKSV